jgi:type I restriction enzyme M protein
MCPGSRNSTARHADGNCSHHEEKNLGTWAICKMNMLLHGLPDAQIEKGDDTIRDPKLSAGSELMLFDRVVANPPFSLDEWGREVAEHDPYERFRFRIPPKTKGDLAFVQHIIATLNVHRRMAVVMPHGVLFRGCRGGRDPQGHPEGPRRGRDRPASQTSSTARASRQRSSSSTAREPPERKGKVLFIEASREFQEGRNQNYLRGEFAKRVA